MPIPSGYAQITHGFSGTGMPTGGAVTLGVDISGYGDPPGDLADIAAGAWNTEMMPFLSDQISLASTLVKYGPDATGPSGTSSIGGTGGDTSDSGYPGACALIQKQTAAGGRAGRGRMYVPGIPEAAIGPDGVLDSGKAAQLLAGFGDYLLTLTTAGVVPVVLHGVGSPLSTPSVITNFNVSSQVATQRRRNRR